ncbi:uncharacterized protein At4g13200, chloroplastic [Morus notabilis]|uniref:uncharacterized protein At4g13200, chloroplastic n=1 Tax=Morus notabilis TaxID=981085 RepID=UPI000CED2BBE|nr:uncharacterized protein At4g13200, chloroplastic [Morus notabilis]
MSGGFAASASPPIVSSYLPSKSKTRHCYSSSFVNPCTTSSTTTPDFKPRAIRFSKANGSQTRLRVFNSSTRPGGGDNESKSVLDAFFLGKALAEALNERIESAVGEFFSTIGRLQSEQQKQVQEFQEDVLERAKRAKEKAAREARESQGLISRSIAVETAPVANGTTSVASTSNDVNLEDQPLSSEQNPSTVEADPDNANQNPVSRVSNED